MTYMQHREKEISGILIVNIIIQWRYLFISLQERKKT